MKKLWLFFCFFFGTTVLALEFKPTPCENLKDWVETERRYMWYKEEKGSFYFREGENIEAFSYLDKDSFKETAFSPWMNEKPALSKNRKIEEREVYAYQEINPIRYLFARLSGSLNQFSVYEIELYDNGEVVPFHLTCSLCTSDFVAKVTDGNFYEGASLKGGEILRIELPNLKYENLMVRFLLHDEGYDMKKIEIKATFENTERDVYYEHASQHYFTHSKPNELEEVVVYLRNMRKGNPKFGEEKISLEPISATDERKVTKRKQYRYQDILYRYYGVERKYVDGYHKAYKEGYQKDEKLYKDYFACKSVDTFQSILEPTFLSNTHKIVEAENLVSSASFPPSFVSKTKSAPQNSAVEKKGTANCTKENQWIFFWVFLFLLLIVLYELWKKHFHEN